MAAFASLNFELIEDHSDEQNVTEKQNSFGQLKNINHKADHLQKMWNGVAQNTPNNYQTKIQAIENELNECLAAARGWTERRNDLAHGYVTKAKAPDYSKAEQPLTTQYSLCPSHARTNKWFNSEPMYNYLASDIFVFAREFVKLDIKIEKLAARIENIRNANQTHK